jgi:hypothetical protein
MNDNAKKMNESSKNPSQGRNSNKKQQSTVGRDIKNRMDDAVIKKSGIDVDPTRSDE